MSVPAIAKLKQTKIRNIFNNILFTRIHLTFLFTQVLFSDC